VILLSAHRSRTVALTDQVFSGGSNFVASIMIARSLDATTFGTFSLTYAALTLVLALTRALIGTRLILAIAHDPLKSDRATSAAFTAVGLTAPLAVMVVMSSYLVLVVPGEGIRQKGLLVALVVAVGAPLVCLQDVLRFAAVAQGKPQAALSADVIWFLLMLLAIPSVAMHGMVWALAIWVGGCLLALGVLSLWLRPQINVPAALGVLRLRFGVSESTAAGVIAGSAASFIVISVSVQVLGPAAAGSLRGAGTLMGPMNVALAFVDLSLVGYLSRREGKADRQFCVRLALGLVAVIGAWGFVLLSMPSSWGVRLLGESWLGARSVLPWRVLEYVALGPLAAALLGLKVRGATTKLILVQTSFAILTAFLGCLGALTLRGTPGVAMFLAGAATGAAILAWGLFLFSQPRRALR